MPACVVALERTMLAAQRGELYSPLARGSGVTGQYHNYGNRSNPAWVKCLSKASVFLIRRRFITTKDTQSVKE